MDPIAATECFLLSGLSDQLTASQCYDFGGLESYDTSLLTSAWQKAIRRGDGRLAKSCALELHRRDADRVWRRIRIIALEDVSVGDLTLSAEILAIAGKRSLRRRWGEERLLSLLVGKMAAAAKCRTACDLVVVLPPVPIGHTGEPVQDMRCFDPSTFLGLAALWRAVTSCSVHAGGRWQSLGRGDGTQRDRYLDRVCAPPLVRFIAARGSATEALNTLLVPAYQLSVLERHHVHATTVAAESWGPRAKLPGYAFCMYTGPGMQALGDFLRGTSWGSRLRALGVRNPRRALGYLVFYAEGGSCTREVVVRHGNVIRQWSEATALGRLGIPADHAQPLIDEVSQLLPLLNEFRRRVPMESQ